MSKEINLNSLIEKYCYICIDGSTDIHSTNEDVKDLLMAFGTELLELAADNASLTDFACEFLQEGASNAIDKQSILDTINQIK